MPAGTTVIIIGYAMDGAGNRSKLDTLRMAVGNLAASTAVITSPASGTVVVLGKSIIFSISGTSPVKVAGIGYQTSGSFVDYGLRRRSQVRCAIPTAILDTLAIPKTATDRIARCHAVRA